MAGFADDLRRVSPNNPIFCGGTMEGDGLEQKQSHKKVEQGEVGDFIASLCADMAKMASASGLNFAAHLLRMATAEAENLADLRKRK
jgi:hypothetical protein